MNAAPLNKGLFSDSDRVQHFLQLLPEAAVREFLDGLANATHHEAHSRMFDEYAHAIESPFLRFVNDDIAQKFDAFNNKFVAMRRFLLEHFFRAHPRSDMIALYPEMRHSHDKSEEVFWNEKFDELRITSQAFRDSYTNLLTTMRMGISGERQKLSLANRNIEYIENTMSIMVNGKPCQLIAAENEQVLARVMLNHQIHEPVSWDVIYETMGTSKSDNRRTSSQRIRSVRDTVTRLNERIQNVFNTDDELFGWKNLNVMRNF